MGSVARTEASSFADRGRSDGAGELLGELFRAHGRTVYGLCSVLLRDGSEAEDAAQQAYLSAYESLQAGVAPAKADAWLLAIARNECLDRLRARGRRPVAPLDHEPPTEGVEEVVARKALFADVRAALEELPSNQRDAILLHEMGGLSYEEIARILDLSVSAVESLLFRGRRRLRAGALRVLAGAIVVPLSLHEELAKAVPGFPAHAAEGAAAGGAGGSAASAAGGSAAAGGGSGLTGAISLKLASLPFVAKLAATAVIVAGASAVAHEVTTGSRSQPVAASARQPLSAAAAPGARELPPTAGVETGEGFAAATTGEVTPAPPQGGSSGGPSIVSPYTGEPARPGAGGSGGHLGGSALPAPEAQDEALGPEAPAGELLPPEETTPPAQTGPLDTGPAPGDYTGGGGGGGGSTDPGDGTPDPPATGGGGSDPGGSTDPGPPGGGGTGTDPGTGSGDPGSSDPPADPPSDPPTDPPVNPPSDPPAGGGSGAGGDDGSSTGGGETGDDSGAGGGKGKGDDSGTGGGKGKGEGVGAPGGGKGKGEGVGAPGGGKGNGGGVGGGKGSGGGKGAGSGD